MAQHRKRIFSTLNLCLSVAPVCLIGLFTVEALWLRFTLGHWPVVYRDLATGTVATVLEWLTTAGLLVVFFGFPVWALSLVAAWGDGGLRRVLLRTGTYLGGIGILLLVNVMNPFGFPEWWLD